MASKKIVLLPCRNCNEGAGVCAMRELGDCCTNCDHRPEGIEQIERIRHEQFLKMALEWRGIETPCPSCGGAGNKTYANTTLWRGGIGGQALTQGVCDKCWGSGDAYRPGVNLRELESKLRRLEKLEAERGGGQ